MSEPRKLPRPKDIDRLHDLVEQLVNKECAAILIKPDKGHGGLFIQPYHTLTTANRFVDTLKLPEE